MGEYFQPLDEDGQHFQTPVYRMDDRLVIPAASVTAMLRGIAAMWQTWRRNGAPLDLETTATLCTALDTFVDQLEAECIAAAGMPPQDTPDGPTPSDR
ncbi:hypothetical protein [Kitasatospora sp. NPDC058190]|uniref:hypothetical protein n=1 Tax=Kitasatospora sp. NPDC058190 TaxID=3346371 RepID=UPI0036DEEC58